MYLKSKQDLKDKEFAVKIQEVKEKHRGYGVTRIATELQAGKERISRISRKLDLDITPRRKKKPRKKR